MYTAVLLVWGSLNLYSDDGFSGGNNIFFVFFVRQIICLPVLFSWRAKCLI